MIEILIRKTRKFRESFLLFSNFMYLCPRKNKVRGVAQLVSAPRSGRGGRTFESSHPDLQSQSLEIEVVAIVVLKLDRRGGAAVAFLFGENGPNACG